MINEKCIVQLPEMATVGKTRGRGPNNRSAIEEAWDAAENGLHEVLPLLELGQMGPKLWLGTGNEDEYYASFKLSDKASGAPEGWEIRIFEAGSYFKVLVGDDIAKDTDEAIGFLMAKGYIKDGNGTSIIEMIEGMDMYIALKIPEKPN